MGWFVHSAMNSEKIPFCLRIDKFSQVARRGYYEGAEFRGKQSDSKWSLVVYANEGEGYEDFIDIRLRRSESGGRDQFVEIKVTIGDYFGTSNLSKEGQFSFTESKDIHQVMSVSNGDMSEFKKLRFLPNDTLTVRGVMTVYEEREITFESEDDFESSLENPSSASFAVLRWILWNLAILLAVAAGICGAFAIVNHVIFNVFLPALYNALLIFIPSMLVFTWLLFWLKSEFQKHSRRKSKTRPNSQYGQEVVPIANGAYQQVMKYSGGKNYNKPVKYGGYGQRVIYVIDAEHFSRHNNRLQWE